MVSIDALVGEMASVFRSPAEQQDELKFAAFKQNLAWHYEANPFYRAQFEATGLRLEDIKTLADLHLAPLLPVRMFKQRNAHALLSVPLDEIDLELRSTGTSGVPSVVRRDHVTTSRAGMAMLGLYRDFFGINNGVGLFLCPSTAEAPEMGMVKVFNLFCGMLDDRTYLVRDYSFRAGEAVEYLRSWQDKQTRHVFGPPFLINRLLRYLEQEDIRLTLDDGSFVVTLGGWKRFNGEIISQEQFQAKIERYLGVPAARVRDMYGLIESNLLAIECEHHKKHVPPWCHVLLRDVEDSTRPALPGQAGVIAVMDALSRSYPSYILTEDVGEVVADGRCACGRVGQVLKFNRRLHGAELGCCAVSIEHFMETQEVALSCELPDEVAAAQPVRSGA